MGSTPFPDRLIDKLMPRLRDVEWRVVCVIVRQTFGWTAGGVPKRADWLSHSQLRRRTGRSSAALSPAIDMLSRSRLIDITDSTGRSLETAQDRRHHRGRLYFKLNDRLFAEENMSLRLKRRIQKVEMTTNTVTIKALVVQPKNQDAQSQATGNQKTDSIRRDWKRVGETLRAKRHQPKIRAK
jgi:hypothetical protein